MTIRKAMLEYFTAGSEEERVDFYAITNFAWCGESSMRTSGWDALVELFVRVPLPMVISEYGCNVIVPRLFQETTTLYSPKMTIVFSGGCAYEFHQHNNMYGLVETTSDGELIRRTDFANLKKRLGETENLGDGGAREEPEWVGGFPNITDLWKATSEIPPFPDRWEHVAERIRDLDWVLVKHEDTEAEGREAHRVDEGNGIEQASQGIDRCTLHHQFSSE
ncbi:MAG: 1,3-beta-glucanosyltransferase gas1 [Pycnora praestabilis]|nr:MAG: 1,3-beta-glucanosyltransferase gas1 [Pycnora praestabilis]